MCPDCGFSIEIPNDAELHEILSCQGCGLELEIIRLQPPLLREIVLEGEDWGE